MADAVVSKTSGQPPCGFESHLRHQLLTQEGNLFQVPFFAFCPIFPGLLHAQACLLTRATFTPGCCMLRDYLPPKSAPRAAFTQDCLLIRAAFAHAAAHPELQPAQGCYPPKAAAWPGLLHAQAATHPRLSPVQGCCIPKVHLGIVENSYAPIYVAANQEICVCLLETSFYARFSGTRNRHFEQGWQKEANIAHLSRQNPVSRCFSERKSCIEDIL